MDDKFHFITFVINYAVFLVQFVLSVFSEKRSKDQFIVEDDVSGTTLLSFDINYNSCRILVQSFHQVSCPT